MSKPSIRGSELPQRQSPRMRSSSSSSTSSDPRHLNRPITDQSPKIGLDRISPRSGGPHTDPLTQKKLEGRISGLESKLGQAQEEVRLLKEQLAKVEAAKSLKNQLKKTDSEISSAKAKENEIASKVNQIEEELEERNENTTKLKKKLESMEEAKETLEAERKRLKVQTEQWRKAAAAVLSGGVEINGRFSERCGSMETHFAARFVGSPGMADDGLGFGKRKGSGMKKFGELWKKKGQK